MTLLTDRHPTMPTTGPPRVRLEPILFHHTMLDGRWWRHSDHPFAELPDVVAAIDAARAPVVRLLLSATGWSRRPHQILVGGRVVTIGYFSDQSPAMLTAICADGSLVTLLVSPGSPPLEPLSGVDVWESEGGPMRSADD